MTPSYQAVAQPSIAVTPYPQRATATVVANADNSNREVSLAEHWRWLALLVCHEENPEGLPERIHTPWPL